MSAAEPKKVVGRYALYSELASGGMATVHIARLLGEAGFARTVAVKRLHSGFAKDQRFVSMFLDEARLAARIRHPNVVPVIDVVAAREELLLVMEFVQGEALSSLLRLTAPKATPPTIAAKIVCDMLYGLHAAHEATGEQGQPLDIVHRDVSPQNLLVGVDGISQVTDFGIAKAANRLETTRDGQLKGKLAYMSPEQLRERPVDRRTDVYAASVVLWEMLAARRLFAKSEPCATITSVLKGANTPPSAHAGVPRQLDAIVMRGLSADPRRRWATAKEMAVAIERANLVAPAADVAAWVQNAAGASIATRARYLSELESSSTSASKRAAKSYASRISIADGHGDVAGKTRVEPASRARGPAHSLVSGANLSRTAFGPLAPRQTAVWAAGALSAVVLLAGVAVIVVLNAPQMRSAEGRTAGPGPSAIASSQAPTAPTPAAEQQSDPSLPFFGDFDAEVPHTARDASVVGAGDAAIASSRPRPRWFPPRAKPKPSASSSPFQGLSRK